jgi:hypothetical protein
MVRLGWSWQDLMDCPPDVLTEVIEVLDEQDSEDETQETFERLRESLPAASVR